MALPPLQMPDTRIALRGGGGGSDNGGGPLQTLGGLMQLAESRDQMQVRRMQVERQRQLEEDDRAIRDTLQRYDSPDEAIGDLYHQGRSSAASLLSKQVYDHRKAQADAYKDQLANYGQRLKLAGNIMSGATDDASYQNARPAVEAMLAPIFGQEGISSILPTTYDKDHVDKLLQMGMDAQERNTAQQNAIVNAREAIRLQNQTANDNEQYKKNLLEARKYWQGSLSTFLGNARNQAEWDYYQEQAVQNGAPKDLVAGFGRQWSKDAAAHAKSLGMTSAQEAADADRDRRLALSEAAGARAEAAAARAEARFQAEGAGGGAGSRLTATKTADLAQDKAKEFEKLEAEIREKHMNAKTGEWDAIPPKLQEEYGRRRLRIENADRVARGLPTLDRAIQNAEQSGDTEGLARLQATKNNLEFGTTSGKAPEGTPAPAATPAPKAQSDDTRARQLLTQLKQTNLDPTTKASIQKELKEILARLQPTPTSR